VLNFKLLTYSILFLLIQASIISAEIRVIKQEKTWSEKECRFKIYFPKIRSKTKNQFIKLNRFFNKEFTDISKYKNEFECNLLSSTPVHFDLNIDFQVKLLTENTLSIYSTISSFTEGNAHPFNQYKVYNYNLQTGEKILLKSLFKEEKIPLEEINRGIRKSFSKDIETMYTDKFEFKDFYLSKGNIYFINLFDVYVYETLEGKVSIKRLAKKLENKNIHVLDMMK
jgi:hypothetical protein